ncbi:citrate lyase ACP [Zymobacter palmae]|nr:citrate lyase acyl carrier protein [Zymobacter palmae]
MTQQTSAHAGSLESCDILVTLERCPVGQGRTLQLNIAMPELYGEHIHALIEHHLDQLGLHDVRVTAEDKGALDATILARLDTAFMRLTASAA